MFLYSQNSSFIKKKISSAINLKLKELLYEKPLILPEFDYLQKN